MTDVGWVGQLEAAPAPPPEARRFTESQIREASALFNSFDADGNGHLSPSELQTRLCDVGYSSLEIEQLIADMDSDHDDRISLDEFMVTYMDFVPTEVSDGDA
eukprot:COSAG01_NODE_2118_length_8383_cov_12.185780_4_plen_103_part_00